MFITEMSDEDIMLACRKTLENKKSADKSKSRTLLEDMSNYISSFDKTKDFFEEYDSMVYENKAHIDLSFYSQLLEKLDEEYASHVESAITNLYTTVNQIYHHINVKPEINNFNGLVTENILTESVDVVKTKMSKAIFEYLNNNFYKLTPETRYKRYYDDARELSKSLIQEGTSPEDAISYSIKVCVMENFLKQLAFPKMVWNRINYLCEDENYAAIFDQPELITLKENFEKKILNIAKIVATCV